MDSTANPSSRFKTIQLLFGAFMMAVLAFSIVTISIAENPMYAVYMTDIYMIVIPIFSVMGIFSSDYFFKTTLTTIKDTDNLSTKLTKYTTATLLKGALLEAPALLAVVAAFLSNNMIYLVFTAVLLLFMYLRFPKPLKFEEEVKLSSQEKSEFRRG